MIFTKSDAPPWEKLSRNTLTPASASALSFSLLLEAGPMVATIFVLMVFLPGHPGNGFQKKGATMPNAFFQKLSVFFVGLSRGDYQGDIHFCNESRILTI
ncbi:hypothetical protein [uncultured Desulfovibrio sp.]|uniref:hypothetical protein n=1 Tax=uncultured Desulfovibrio sp. TaxID=167968 RepID=UPI00260C24BD|nr:hypothetical protein [uncultured Desulfovibrio sp.]